MTAEFLAGIAGVVLSLLFSYVPGLNAKFAGLESTYKRLIMLALLFVSAGAIYGLACAGWAADLGIAVTCDKAGLIQVLQAFGAAAIANQAAYALSPETKPVAEAKASRA